MHTDITFKNLDASDALRNYALKKLSRMDKYIDRPAEARVVLSVAKIRHTAEITLHADGSMINAEETTGDMYSAIDLVMDKVEKQLKKHKDKLHGKKGQTKASAEDIPAPEKGSFQPEIILEKDYFVKPMSVEEAVLQLDISTTGFIIFQNTESGHTNLIYKRKDGNLGLIETQN
ncbi:MAG: ribosome-associated translation inhibitor RaiA [Thermodesulfobacteriota bacterium]|nr:ribosome-associated translation inhibitor RaiA [Thermodesulfobacteriota bacterium]